MKIALVLLPAFLTTSVMVSGVVASKANDDEVEPSLRS